LALPFHSPESHIYNTLDPDTMKPSLDKIFGKAIQFSKNIVMLLPPNINIEKVGELVAKEYIEAKIPSSTCSIKIEKVFFMSQLQYLVMYIGSIIESEINLNDELLFIYNYLKGGEKATAFNHKKVVRELRERYGMISLLNFVFELDKVKETGTLIEKLYIFIRSHELIPEERLQKLMREQKEEYERYSKKKISINSREDVEECTEEETGKEHTLSNFSGATDSILRRVSNLDDSTKQKVTFPINITGGKRLSCQSINTISFSPEDRCSEQSRTSDCGMIENAR
jgi:SepF-like predicted cell division protein (DUF552 family)